MQIRTRIKTGDPATQFDKDLIRELLSFTHELSRILNKGINIVDNFSVAPQSHIVDADGSLADLTSKFNTLLAELEAMGILESS